MTIPLTSFTDAHGIYHTNAVLMVEQANQASNASITHSRQPDDSYRDETVANDHVSYSILYWPSQAAKDAGAVALKFIDQHQQSQFNFQRSGVFEYTGQPLMEAVESHFTSQILSHFFEE